MSVSVSYLLIDSQRKPIGLIGCSHGAGNDTLSKLIKTIKEEVPNGLKGVDLNRFQLWKLNRVEEHDIELVNELIARSKLPRRSTDSDSIVEPLRMTHELKDLNLRDDQILLIQVLSDESPPNPSTNNTTKIPTTGFLKFYKTSPYGSDAPSSAARPSQVVKTQCNSVKRILNDRPEKDVSVTPIALLYPPFGQFRDHINHPPRTLDGLNCRDMESAVDNFISLVCKYYPDEHTRRPVLIPALDAILGCYTPQNFQMPSLMSRSSAKRQRTDGRIDGPANTPELIVEIKNEQGCDGADPDIQLSSYYTRLHGANLDISTKKYKNTNSKKLSDASLLPALGISIIGPRITFNALVMLDRPRLVELTSLSAVSSSGDITSRSKLFHAFCAACVLLRSIREDSLQILENPPPPSERNRTNLPCVQKIPAWRPTSDQNSELEFQILKVAFQDGPTWNENRFMYTAKTKDGIVLVKFTHYYCPELHSFCADRGHAPKLLGYGTVPGSWKVVVMELISPGDKVNLAPNYWAKWKDAVMKLVTDFHEQGWVHGDLRGANFIISADRPEIMMLLDFDWGGEFEKAFYPTWSLNSILVDKTVEDLRIRKAHDIRVLTATLEELRPKTKPDAPPPQ